MLSEKLKTAKYLAIYETGGGGAFIAMVKNTPTLHLRIKTAIQATGYTMDKISSVEIENDVVKITTAFKIGDEPYNDVYKFDLLPGNVY